VAGAVRALRRSAARPYWRKANELVQESTYAIGPQQTQRELTRQTKSQSVRK
jgi:hypothetical protein